MRKAFGNVTGLTTQPSESEITAELRSYCRAETPLDARLDPWMVDLLTNRSDGLQAAVERHGSPLNLVATAPFERNATELSVVAQGHGLRFRVFFARKANKALSFVEAAIRLGMGVDVASQQECAQSLECGVSGDAIICTAAVKPTSLIRLCIQQGVTIAVDNWDELSAVSDQARDLNRTARVAIRFSGFTHKQQKLDSRFGFDIQQVGALLDWVSETNTQRNVTVVGVHFHLDGYCPQQRISAMRQCLPVIDRFRAAGQEVHFLDIGGGLPMSYLQSDAQWHAFWERLRAALLGRQEPITYRNHGLGLTPINGEIYGNANVYPYYQAMVRGEWLDLVLAATSDHGDTMAQELNARDLELRCEPGRSLLDGCGMTVARVEFCKRHPSGQWYIGLGMNHTQCRTGSDDFLVDPIVVRGRSPQLPTDFASKNHDSIEGYLVGTYCTESELILLRKFQFPRGIAAGDLLALPNTAGYLMHFLESRSHQFPLAKNLVVQPGTSSCGRMDAIDLMES